METVSKLSLEKTLYRAAQDLEHSEFRVLVILMTYTDEHGGNAHPSLSRIAGEAKCSKSTVTRAMRKLETLGYVVKTEQGGHQYGLGRANVYRIQVPERIARGEPVEKAEGSAPPEVTTWTAPSTQGVRENTLRGASHITKGCVRTTEGVREDTPSDPLPDPQSNPLSDPPVSRARLRRAPEREGKADNPPDLLDAIQRAAGAGNYTEAHDDLLAVLTEHHGPDLAELADRAWTVPAKATDRYEAGKWANKLLSTAEAEGIPTGRPRKTPRPQPQPEPFTDDAFDDPAESLEAERARQLAALDQLMHGRAA